MFEVAQYAPLLHTRTAEIRGLRELPEATKDQIFPIFVIRPWPRAKSIDTAFEKLGEAFGDRVFAVDLEREFPHANPDKPAQVEFDALRSPNSGFENYYAKLASIDGAVPVLQLTGDIAEIPLQIERILEIGRGGFARITRDDAHLVGAILASIDGQHASDFSIIVDAGWATDVLQQADWARGLATTFFNQDPERAIVICGSSFSAEFGKVKGSTSFQIGERLLYANVRNNLNANLIYGDWASTRPPSYDDGIRRTVPRLDLSFLSAWDVFRSRKLEHPDDEYETYWESYREVAGRVLTSASWDDVPPVWGRYAIECTAADMPVAIKSPITAAAARINLHIHVQANFNTPQLLGNTDDPYED